MSYALTKPPLIKVDLLIDKKKATQKIEPCFHLVGKDGIVLCNCYLLPREMSLLYDLSIGDGHAGWLCPKSRKVYDGMVANGGQ